MAAEEAKQEAQDKAATGDEDGPTLGSNSAEAMARSNEAHASDSECSDEDVEETRRRRGGGVVTGRRVADPNMIRSSSLTLRSFTEKETNQAEVPDWTLSQ